ncbi:MAG: HEPN domain-containing protein [Tepidisphaeraceae bacterium]
MVKGWPAKGDSDLAEAKRCVGSMGPYDTGCFPCQQAVEKYFKAVLCFHGQTPTPTHDLRRLIVAIEQNEPSLKLARPEVLVLTDYAVRLRYDSDFWPTQIEAAEAQTVRLEVVAVIPQNMHPAPPGP